MTSPRAQALRVITLNMWHNDVAVQDRLAAAAAQILASTPDIVCLQEVRHGPTTTGGGNHPNLAAALAELTGMQVAVAGATFPLDSGARSGLAILTTLEVTSAQMVPLEGAANIYNHAATAWLRSPSGRDVLAISAHLAWGNRGEPARVGQAVAIDTLVEAELAAHTGALAPVVVLTGDFNTGPTSDTVRFLTGEGVSAGRGTLRVDAWAVAGCGAGVTSGPGNTWAATTARQVGIADASMLPDRRIDFILVHGWVYGRAGFPLDAQVIFTHHAEPGAPVGASDHYGVMADLWDPTP